MLNIVIYVVLLLIFLMLVNLTYQFPSLVKKESEEDHSDSEEKISIFQGFVYTAIVLVIIGLLAHTYFIIRGTALENHLMEWLNIVVRVMHITFGIAWIGASFYFVFLENALNRTRDVRDELAGNLWAIHGGGF